MAAKQDDGGTTYGPSWYDVAVSAASIHGATGWKITWDAHVETFTGKVRTYWKVHALRPSHGHSGAAPLITRGDFFPSPMCSTVPALLHRLMAQVDSDIAQQTQLGPLSDMPLFAPPTNQK